MEYKDYNTNEIMLCFSPLGFQRRQEACTAFSREILESLIYPGQELSTYIRIFEDTSAQLLLKLPNKQEIIMKLQAHERHIAQY